MNKYHNNEYNLSPNTKDWIKLPTDEIALSEGYIFDIETALRVRSFANKVIRHIHNPWIGKPFDFLPWQWNDIIAPLFGWIHKDTRLRRYNNVNLFIPKKNGKTFLDAIIALYCMTADREYAAEVYSAAIDKEQASIIYNLARAITNKSPALKKALKVRASYRKIDFSKTASFYRVLSGDGFRNEGLNTHCLLFDELHTQKSRELYAALQYSCIARQQGLQVFTTTFGDYENYESSLWYEIFTYNKSIVQGKSKDIHTLPALYYTNDAEDIENPMTWYKCNPSLGYIQSESNFKSDFINAQHSIPRFNDFKRYRLNMIAESNTAWIPYRYWHACHIDNKPKANTPIYAGLDTASTRSFNALATIYGFNHEEYGECLFVDFQLFLPELAGTENDVENRPLYESFFNSGAVNAVPGMVSDPEHIAAEVASSYQSRQISEIAIDRYNDNIISKELKRAFNKKTYKLYNIHIVTYNAVTMNEATKLLERMILSRKIYHNGNPAVDWMFKNIKIITDSGGNIKIDKRSNQGKVDAFSALVMAIYCMMNKTPKFVSRYASDPTIAVID